MYRVVYLAEVVQKQIPKLSLPVKSRIKKAIEKKLTIDPIAFGKPLQYSLKGLRRLRVGDYRIVYKVDASEKRVIVLNIAHRKEVYE